MSTEFWVGPFDSPDRIQLGPAVSAGAEGVLYRASWRHIEVAVKMLQPGHLDRLEAWTSRWREQVELLRGVVVPGLVRVHGGFVGPLPHPRGHADHSTASLYLIMDWVEGVPLDRWLTSVGEAEPEQLLLTLVPVAAALDLLHSGAGAGGTPLVHRDVKPANILVRPGGETVLVDVGALRGLGGNARRSGVAGTPGYIAPEVRADGQASAASDRFALGAVAYFLLTHTEPPVDATTDSLRRHLSEAPLTSGRPELVDHVMAMLDPVPGDRPAPLGNWVAALRRSSLIPLPGEGVLPPLAPSRHPEQVERPVATLSPPRRRRFALWFAAAGVSGTVIFGAPTRLTAPDVEPAEKTAGLTKTVAPAFDATDCMASTVPLEDATPDESPTRHGNYLAFSPGPLTTRGEPAMAWTGQEVVVIGGLAIDQYRALSDAAALDPLTGQWRQLASRPDPGRVYRAVWTGQEVITLGGEGTASGPITTAWSYNVSADCWNEIALPPWRDPPGVLAWTGTHLLGWTDVGGALYDPSTDEWSKIPTSPVATTGAATWTGRHLVVQGSTVSEQGGQTERRLLIFDPTTAEWRISSTPPVDFVFGPDESISSTSTGVFLLGEADATNVPTVLVFDVDRDSWRALARPWFGGSTTLVAMDDRMRAVKSPSAGNDMEIWTFDPRSGEWTVSSGGAPSIIRDSLVATDNGLFFFGITTANDVNAYVQPREPNGAYLWSG